MSAKVNSHSRGGYYKNWQDASGGAEPTAQSTVHPGPVPIKEEDDSNDEAEADAGTQTQDEEGDETSMIDPALQSREHREHRQPREPKGKEPMRPNTQESTRPAQPEATPPPPTDEGLAARDDIQILELHSDKPLISYRGRLFEGEWAEVIGTEALLTRHDERSPLPHLRQVPGDIDLLGALSSRLVTRETTAVARQKDDDPLAATREEWNIRVPPGKDRTGERRQQARFLENLMALKKMRGETDNVTVFALDGEGKDFDDTKDPDYKPRRKRVGTASASLAPSVSSSTGRPRGRGRGRGRTKGMSAVARGKQRAVTSHPQSTPTPLRWDELDEDEGDAMDEDGDEDDDVSMD